jgi:pyruvate ferredoxin oxidoreductase alpha subunit
MSQRDCGWIQLFAETNQEAADLHIQAFRIAEELSLPVMVCMDGFILTHAYERIDLPTQVQVDAFLPPYQPRQVLDPKAPISIGAMVGPEAFMEVRYLAHHRQLQALELLPDIALDFEAGFGRASGGLVHPYRLDGAETVVIALGSVLGTIKDVVDEMRDQGSRIGVLGICSYRPFPAAAIRDALKSAKRWVVIEKALAVGMGGVLATDVRMALAGDTTAPGATIPGSTVIAGLGGRAITKTSLHRVLGEVLTGKAEPVHFLDLDHGIVARELERMRVDPHSGPIAENLLKDVGAVAARIA